MPAADRYIVYVGGLTACRSPDGKVELSEDRAATFGFREARRIARHYKPSGKRIVIRLATEDEVAWLRGGRRMGSDWRAY